MRSLKIVVPFCAVFCLTSSQAADWPMYLANLSHTSFTPNEIQINSGSLSQLRQMWKINVGATIASGVTASNGMLFFGAWDGRFYAVNSTTGATLWSQFLGVSPDPADPSCGPGHGVSAQPVVSGDTVYAAGGDSAVYALNRNTGDILWRTQLADPQAGGYLWASMTLSNNALYVGIASLTDCPLVRGGLARIALDNPAQPQIQYFVPDGSLGASVWSTPAIDEQAGLIYVTLGNADTQDAGSGIWGSALLALDAASLAVQAYFFRPIASTDDDPDWGSSPTLFQTSDGQQYLAANGKNGVMYVLHRPDLTLVWQAKMATDCDSPELGCGSISTPAFDGHTLYSGAGQSDQSDAAPGTVYAFDPVKQVPIWTHGAAGVVLGPVTVTPGLVFVPTLNGLSILDAGSGNELWNDGGTTGMVSQAVVANGAVYATYVNGDVIAWTVPANGGPAALVASRTALSFGYTSGGPAPDAQAIDLYASAGSLSVTVRSDSPWLSADQQTARTPATLNVTANGSALAPGSYTGTLNLTPGSGGTPVSINVQFAVGGPLPAITAANIANAASFQSGILAPGSLFTIISTNLAGATATSSGTPWPTTLAGTSVTVAGIPAPLQFVSPTQINGQVPFGVPLGSQPVVISSNGSASNPAPVTIAPAAPGIFMADQTRAAAVNADGTLNSAANPAPPGSAISLYFTGQGQVDQPVDDGSAPPWQQLSQTLAPSAGTIGGIDASVLFCGLAPGYVGLAQANLQVPDLPSGSYPVVLNLADATSNAGVIFVGSTPQ
ncbi:MAG TPA: PQQ-binding-like beta-propeller repeat protein [Bryobacteraceae bacterium]